MDEEDILLTLGYLWLKRSRRRKQQETKNVRKMWARDIFKQRENKGVYHTLVQEMVLGDRGFYLKNVKFASFATSSPTSIPASFVVTASSHANRFLFLSLKNLSTLSYKTVYFLTASASFSSTTAILFIVVVNDIFCHKFFLLASRKIVLRTLRNCDHTKKMMKQAWSKREADADVKQEYQNFLISLLHVLRLLHTCFTCFTCYHTMLASASASASQVWIRL